MLSSAKNPRRCTRASTGEEGDARAGDAHHAQGVLCALLRRVYIVNNSVRPRAAVQHDVHCRCVASRERVCVRETDAKF